MPAWSLRDPVALTTGQMPLEAKSGSHSASGPAQVQSLGHGYLDGRAAVLGTEWDNLITYINCHEGLN